MIRRSDWWLLAGIFAAGGAWMLLVLDNVPGAVIAWFVAAVLGIVATRRSK